MRKKKEKIISDEQIIMSLIYQFEHEAGRSGKIKVMRRFTQKGIKRTRTMTVQFRSVRACVQSCPSSYSLVPYLPGELRHRNSLLHTLEISQVHFIPVNVLK